MRFKTGTFKFERLKRQLRATEVASLSPNHIWYLVSGIWYLVSGIWYLVSGIGALQAPHIPRLTRQIELSGPYKNQFDRAVLGLALNLSEGSSRESKRDRRRFYEIALGSIRETQTLIEILELKGIRQLTDQLAASAYCRCRSLPSGRRLTPPQTQPQTQTLTLTLTLTRPQTRPQTRTQTPPQTRTQTPPQTQTQTLTLNPTLNWGSGAKRRFAIGFGHQPFRQAGQWSQAAAGPSQRSR